MDRSSCANWTSAQNCSHCQLGIRQLQLSSPFGYNDEAASKFSSLTASCTAADYTYATPAPYALNATESKFPTREPCVRSYTVQEGDSCISISLNMNVSTHGIIRINGFDIGCKLLPAVGSIICLPEPGETYQLDMYERCEGIPADTGITLHQILACNLIINDFCSNLYGWYVWNLCVRLVTCRQHLYIISTDQNTKVRQVESSTQVKATLSLLPSQFLMMPSQILTRSAGSGTL